MGRPAVVLSRKTFLVITVNDIKAENDIMNLWSVQIEISLGSVPSHDIFRDTVLSYFGNLWACDSLFLLRETLKWIGNEIRFYL